MKKLFTLLFLSIFLFSFASAFEFDNIMDYNYETETIIIENAFGLGENLIELSLQGNGCDDNMRDCSAVLPITLYEEGQLIEGRRFYTIDGDEQYLQDVRWSKLEYYSNGEWIEFNEEETFNTGYYLTKLSGEKKPSRKVDWQIKVKGEWTTPWAIWEDNQKTYKHQETLICSGAGSTNNWGIVLNSTQDVYITSFNFNSGQSGVTGGNIKWTNNTVISSGTKSGNTIEFSSPVELLAGVSYVFDVDVSSGNSCEDSTATFPYDDDIISFTSGWLGSSPSATRLFSIENITGYQASVTLNSPADSSISDTNDITFNATANVVGGATLENISLWTNESGTWGMEDSINVTFFNPVTQTAVSPTGGNTLTAKQGLKFVPSEDIAIVNVTKYVFTTATKAYITDENATTIAEASFSGNTATFSSPVEVRSGESYYLLADNSGASYSSWLDVTSFPISETYLDWTAGTGNGGLGDSSTVGYNFISITVEGNNYPTNNSRTQIWNKTITDNIIWNVESCDSDGDCGFAVSNYSLSIDTVVPSINVSYPTGSFDLLTNGQSLNLNYSINDTNLESCWYEYNNANTTIANCSLNTTFTYVAGYNNITVYANDTVGNQNNDIQTWTPRLTENSQTFSSSATEGGIQSFTANITLDTGEGLESASLVYNGTYYSGSILSSEQTRILSVTDFTTPNQDSDANISFYWEVNLSNPTTINLSEQTQTVSVVNVDNCSSYNNTILTLNLFEELGRTELNGTIEITYDVLNTPDYNNIFSLSAEFDNVNNVEVCSSINLTGQGFAYDAEIRYVSTGYVPEFYHIQRADIIEGGDNISLYDLNENESTEFTVTYKNSAFILTEGAIIQLQRKYIGEGTYDVVEAPLTGDSGKAILHIDLDSRKYQASVVKDGEVLDFFDNIVFECENELSGECTYSLDGTVNPNNDIPIETITDFSYSISVDEDNQTISVLFSVPSGTPASINVLLEQSDLFGNTTSCNTTVITSAGSITCDYQDSIEKSVLMLSISKDDVQLAVKGYMHDPELDMDGMNFFIVFMFTISLVGMAISSPEWMVIISVMTLVISGTMLLVNGMSIVIGLGAIGWVVVAAGIILFKLAKQEDK